MLYYTYSRINIFYVFLCILVHNLTLLDNICLCEKKNTIKDIQWPNQWHKSITRTLNGILQLEYYNCQSRIIQPYRYGCILITSNGIRGTMASQITSLRIVYSTVYSGADQRKHQSSASLAFVRGIHRWPMNSPHKGPVTRKMFLFDDVIMPITIFCENCEPGSA